MELDETAAHVEVGHLVAQGIDGGHGIGGVVPVGSVDTLDVLGGGLEIVGQSLVVGLEELVELCEAQRVAVLAYQLQHLLSVGVELGALLAVLVQVGECQHVGSLDELVRVAQHLAEPLRCGGDLVDAYLAVVVGVHEMQRALFQFQTFHRTTQHGPHGLVQLVQMGDVLAGGYLDACHAT